MIKHNQIEHVKFFLIILFFLVLDQVSKNFMVLYFQSSILNELYIIKLTSFFNLVLNWNKGVSFGMLNNINNGDIILSVVMILMIVSLFIWYFRSKNKKLLLPLSMIISGALGNLMDRIRYGAVVDFLDFHVMEYHYPSFNIADSVIVIGLLMILYYDLRGNKSNAS